MRIYYTLVGLLFDLFDWIGLGMIPVFGDVIDAVAMIYWVKVIGPAGLAEAIEFIPGADILPTNIVFGLYADSKRRGGK
jgi:hypothetical protein